MKKPSTSKLAAASIEKQTKKKKPAKKYKPNKPKVIDIPEQNLVFEEHQDQNLLTGEGPPEVSVEDPTHGMLYVDSITADAFIYVEDLGWIQLNSWCPDVGEGPPSADNPPNPETGSQYIDILTGDQYYFVEGLGWVLVNGIEGPAGPVGPAGPPGFADVFYAVTPKERQEIQQNAVPIVWDVPEFQDTCYQLEEIDRKALQITNSSGEPIRYQIRVKLTSEYHPTDTERGLEGEFYLMQDRTVVPGCLTYTYGHHTGVKNSINFSCIVEIERNTTSELVVEGRVRGGKLVLLSDSSSYFEVIKMG